MVEGASTPWPTTAWVEPGRKASESSMRSPPASAEWITVIALCPGVGPTRGVTQIDVVVEQFP